MRDALSESSATALRPALVDDASIASATVVGGDRVRRGSRVKHWGQQYTWAATATVVGFADIGTESRPWIKVLVEHDSDKSVYAEWPAWDWDRTEAA